MESQRIYAVKDEESLNNLEDLQGASNNEIKEDRLLQRLIEVYNQIAQTDDIAYKLASLLTISNNYGYAMRISNVINGRQGKNRITVSYETSKLMKYSLETDVDSLLDERLTELLVTILNTYLSDKQELPSSRVKVAAGMLSKVKALFIMLVTTNQYGLITYLNIPNYMLRYVSDLFDNIRILRDNSLEHFIAYLKESGNVKMAEIVRAAGNEFWGSEGVKANVIYDRYFGSMVDEIKDPVITYQKYLEYRAEYRKSTKNILPIKLYSIFDITADAYNRARLNVYNEIRELFPDDENANAIKRLIYEQ